MPGFHDDHVAHLPAFKRAIRDRPEFIREATGATLALPLVAGLLAFVGVGLIVWGLGGPVRLALVAAGLAVLAAGVYWTLDNKSIMSTTETIEGVDPVALPAPRPPSVTAWTMPKAEGNGLRMGRFNIPDHLLGEWCQVAYREGPLAYSAWVPKFCAVFKGQGRQKFDEFRQDWIDEGFGEDAKGNRGLVLTDAGWDYCERVLRMLGMLKQATPLPSQLGAGQAERAPSIHAHAGTQGE